MCRGIFFAVLLVVALQQSCRFAPQFDAAKLRSNATYLDEFIRTAISWEAKFIKEVGVQESTGMTFDGQRVDYDSGELLAS